MRMMEILEDARVKMGSQGNVGIGGKGAGTTTPEVTAAVAVAGDSRDKRIEGKGGSTGLLYSPFKGRA